jgi:hypothetical protein
METKDYVYIGLIAVTAAVFYWHGYLAARSRTGRVIKSVLTPRPIADLPISGMDMDSTQPVKGHRIIRPAGLRRGRKSRIRAVFGVN